MADFQGKLDKFRKLETVVIAASVDSREVAENTVDAEGLDFTVGYGLEAEAISRLTGAFYEGEKKFLHATGFIVDRKGTIKVAVYSTGPIGRLTTKDSLGLIEHLQQQEETA